MGYQANDPDAIAPDCLIDGYRQCKADIKYSQLSMQQVINAFDAATKRAEEWEARAIETVEKLDAERKRADEAEANYANSEDCFRVVVAEREDLKAENAHQRAAIATPEVYAGVISKVVEQERDNAVAENARLRGLLERAFMALAEMCDNSRLEQDIAAALKEPE